MMAKAAVILCSCIFASACGRYSDFSLPHPNGQSQNVRWLWVADPEPLRSPADGEVDVLNPSIANHRLFYSIFDGKAWHTAVDGRRVLSPEANTWEGSYIAANGSVIYRDGEYLHWYHAAGPEVPKIGFARSKDGEHWQKHSVPVLDVGPRGSWDERGVADPYVIESGGELYLFYLGQDRARRQRLGIARSSDGIVWTKLRSNPILELGSRDLFDEFGLGEPAVWQSHGVWWMIYTGRGTGEIRRMGLAQSEDGIHWQKISSLTIGGTQAWNAKVICDPHVELQTDGRVKVWFGGGDVAHPSERIHGRLGVGWLTPQ